MGPNPAADITPVAMDMEYSSDTLPRVVAPRMFVWKPSTRYPNRTYQRARTQFQRSEVIDPIADPTTETTIVPATDLSRVTADDSLPSALHPERVRPTPASRRPRSDTDSLLEPAKKRQRRSETRQQLVHKFQKACHQVTLLNNKIDDLQARYNRSTENNQIRHRYNLRIQLCVVQGLRDLYYEYAARVGEKIEAIQNAASAITLLTDTTEATPVHLDSDDDEVEESEDEEDEDVASVPALLSPVSPSPMALSLGEDVPAIDIVSDSVSVTTS